MKKQHKIAFYLLFLLLLVVLRSEIFGLLFTYKSVGERSLYEIKHPSLLAKIEGKENVLVSPDGEQVADLALRMSSETLYFGSENCSNDPNTLGSSHKAHCVGYAVFHASVCNALLKKYKLDTVWQAQAHIGKIYFLGYNLHTLFSSPFLKDHDFVLLLNKKTGKTFALDPSLADYLGVKRVSFVD